MKFKEKKKINPYTKNGLVQCRVDNDDMKIIVDKATIYTEGDLSKFVRMACLNYRPLTRKALK